MTGPDRRVIGEWQNLPSDSGDESLEISAWKIPPTDAAAKENVSAEKKPVFGKMKTQAARAMTGHFEHIEAKARDLEVRLLGQYFAAGQGLDLEFESPVPEKLPIRYHGQRVGMHVDGAGVPAMDRRRVGDMIEVTVRQQERGNWPFGEVAVGTLWSVDQDVSGLAGEEKTIRVEHAAGKFFEPNHEKVVCVCMRSLISLSSSATLLFMRSARTIVFLLVVALVPSTVMAAADLDKVSMSVARLLEQAHYSRQKLNDEMSQKVLDQYLRDLDPNKLFFTQADIDGFQSKYARTIDDAILSGSLDPAREIFAVYKQRVTDRVESNKKLADREYKFDSDEVVSLNRKDAPWPKDEAEADSLWAKRVEAELLQETLNEHAIDPAPKIVKRRQDQLLRGVSEMDDESVVSSFLGALARSYDPHSEYMSPSDLANFEIEMKKSLEGVGAVLQSEDGYAKVKQVVPGGPADLDGRLKVNDRIAAVAQGDKEFEDVVDMKLDKVVAKIRGRQGSTVRLQVIPAAATDPSKRKIVTIRRDKVDLKEQKARAEINDVTFPDGQTRRIGWIEVPSFYADLDKPGVPGAVSTTADVSLLLERLKKENIESLVVDLRQDGGGSLEEAINLTGLFIPKGPVVQSKDHNGKVSVSYDHSPLVAYDGPMVVLINRLSASASEIFAAALQDYGRAVIVGDERSFGKGTVQTMVDIGRFMPFFSLGASDAGALKLTINKFYRVGGGSTQLDGVQSDIVLPSLTDNPEFGESSLTNPLPYDEVAPQRIERDGSLAGIVEHLKELSENRRESDPEFGYIVEDMTRLRERIDANNVSLSVERRKAEIAEENKRREARKKERAARGNPLNAVAYEVTLDNYDKAELTKVDFDRKKESLFVIAEDEKDLDEEEDEVLPDPIRNEALRIAGDMVQIVETRRTAAVQSGEATKTTP